MKSTRLVIYFFTLTTWIGMVLFETKKGFTQKTVFHPQQDTIEFKMNWAFNGDCGEDCNKYIATDIIKVNSDSVIRNNICYNLFLKCPSKIRLQSGAKYRFIAKTMNLNSCTTIIDTCIKNRYYYLTEQLP